MVGISKTIKVILTSVVLALGNNLTGERFYLSICYKRQSFIGRLHKNKQKNVFLSYSPSLYKEISQMES